MHQHPPGSCNRIPRGLSVWGPSCRTHSGEAVGHPDGSVRGHSPSATLGLRARGSPHRIPSPRSGSHGLLKRKAAEVSLSRLGGHSTAARPLQWGGGLHSGPLDSEPPEGPIVPPGGSGASPAGIQHACARPITGPAV